MDAITIQIVSTVAILGFMWKLYQEVSDLHRDNAALHKGMANLRQEVGKDMAEMRQEFGRDMADLRQEFGRDTADLRERMARMEGLLEGFVGRPQESQP